jgi:hypothetical protein
MAKKFSLESSFTWRADAVLRVDFELPPPSAWAVRAAWCDEMALKRATTPRVAT